MRRTQVGWAWPALLSVGALAALPLAVTAGAQDAAPAAAAATVDHDKQLAELIEKYEDAYEEWVTAYRAASEEERSELYPKMPGPEFVEQFEALAKAAKGSEAAAGAWMQVVNLAGRAGQNEKVVDACDALLSDHIGSDKISDLPMTYRYTIGRMNPRGAEEGLRKMLAESPNKTVQGMACFQLAGLIKDRAGDEETPEEWRKLIDRVVTEFADVEDSRGTKIADSARGEIFEIERLQVGMEAPDIEADDLNGVAFKLSDYRGKVVLLDFWGDW